MTAARGEALVDSMLRDPNALIAALDRSGEPARMTEPVSPDPEIRAVTCRVAKSGWPKKLATTPDVASCADEMWRRLQEGWRS